MDRKNKKLTSLATLWLWSNGLDLFAGLDAIFGFIFVDVVTGWWLFTCVAQYLPVSLVGVADRWNPSGGWELWNGNWLNKLWDGWDNTDYWLNWTFDGVNISAAVMTICSTLMSVITTVMLWTIASVILCWSNSNQNSDQLKRKKCSIFFNQLNSQKKIDKYINKIAKLFKLSQCTSERKLYFSFSQLKHTLLHNWAVVMNENFREKETNNLWKFSKN